ncbi:major capsid protein P2 [Marinomonas posidonica]|uniref:major capsid protein P2 n=1 Tax=Marinomonas posidonica TaxID=936476 RepID=UPI003736B345
MLLIPKRLNGFNGVGWGSKASMSLATGPTYNEIQLVTSLTAAQIRQVSVILNGDTIIQVTGKQLVMMEKYKKHHVQEAQFDGDGNLTQKGIFVIPFTNPNAKNQNGAYFGGLVTLQGENITLEVEIENGSGALSLEAFSYQAPAQSRRIFEPRIKEHIFQANATGWNDFTTLPTGADINIRRAYFKGDLKRLIMERDGITLFDVTAEVQAFQQQRTGRAPQEGYFILDPTMYGFEQADILNTGKKSEFVFRTELGKAEAVPILVESVKQVAQIAA